MHTTNVLHEISPYAWVDLNRPHDTRGYWQWRQVLTMLQRYESTGEVQRGLPAEVQRPGALLGLTIGLLVRQAALAGARGY